MLYKEKTIALNGQYRLPSGRALHKLESRLKKEIERAIAEGFNTFIFGAHAGFDLFAAGIILKYSNIVNFKNLECVRLIAVLPFEEQAANWSETARKQYYNTLPKCDEVITLNTRFHKDSYKDQNAYLIENSSRLICYRGSDIDMGIPRIVISADDDIEVINIFEELNK